MEVLSYTIGFVILVFIYVIYSSYNAQVYLKRRKVSKKFLNEFTLNVKGDFMKSGYFAKSHKVISVKEYKALNKKHRMEFTNCYNIVSFRTQDANFEFFFHMIKEGVKFSEVLNIRVFPKNNRIKSEGNIERNYSRLNIYTNNHYLTQVLETKECTSELHELLRINTDIIIIFHNNIHYKVFMNSNKMSVSRIMQIIKSLNFVKNKVYRDNVLEY